MAEDNSAISVDSMKQNYPKIADLLEDEDLEEVVGELRHEKIKTMRALEFVSRETLLAKNISGLFVDIVKPVRDGNETSEKSPSLEVPEVAHWQRLTPCARLGESFLRDPEQGLEGYADAASACLEDDESQTLAIITELVELQDEKDGKGIGCFATIVASSGTGKTQLAATASIDDDVRSLATVLYVNASPGGSQDFYKPHETLGRALLLALKSFKEYIGSVYSASATTIHDYWSKVLKENNLFCGFLHYLLFGSYASSNGMTSLEDIHRTLLDQNQRFLFFIDEVPSQDQDNLGVVLFFGGGNTNPSQTPDN